MTDVSVKRVKTTAQFNDAIDDYVVEGYKLKSRGNGVAVLSKAGSYGGILGHLLVFVFFGWWTVLIANLLYAGYRYFSESKEVRLKLEGKE